MKTIRTGLICTALCAGPLAAHADVTLNVTTAGKASFLNVGGDGVTYIMGNRMRNEQGIGGKMQVLIIDIDGRRFVDLDAKKKSALVTPLDSISDELQKVETSWLAGGGVQWETEGVSIALEARFSQAFTTLFKDDPTEPRNQLLAVLLVLTL